MDFQNFMKIEFCWMLIIEIWSSINLPWGHVRFHTKFGPNRFTRFDVYWIKKNKHPNRQIDKQSIDIDERRALLYRIYIIDTLLFRLFSNIIFQMETLFQILFCRWKPYFKYYFVDGNPDRFSRFYVYRLQTNRQAKYTIYFIK